MKSISEIQELLMSELYLNRSNINSECAPDYYYNDKLGDCSFLLAALLELLLIDRFEDWKEERWLDDTLITKAIVHHDNKISIWGVMIWGITDTTEQWTDPFYFEIMLNSKSEGFSQYTFLFEDLDNPYITYEYFSKNRDYWDRGYYLNDDWDLSERDWRYKIRVNYEDV